MSYFDENEDRLIYGRRHGRLRDDEEQEHRTPRCNRCGSAEVRWRQQGGRWVLFSLTPGVVHNCDSASKDEFEVLS